MQLPMSKVAVLVIDMLNTYQHEDAELLAPNVADIVDRWRASFRGRVNARTST